MTFNWKYCLFALALLLSCSDNPRLDYPSEESLFPKVSGSAGSSNSVEEGSSSSVAESSSSNLETEDSSSSSAENGSSVEESSSSPIAESSSSSPETAGSSSSAGGSSSSVAANSSSSVQSSSSALKECTSIFDTETKFCYDGETYFKCANHKFTYDPASQICTAKDEIETVKCSGKGYNPLIQQCTDGIVETKCGNGWYNAEIKFCSKNTVYDKCGGNEYTPTEENCCVNAVYSKSTQQCTDGIVETKCGSGWYNSLTHNCCNNSEIFSKSTQQCTDGIVETKCGNGWYNAEIKFCSSDKVYDKCDGGEYNPTEENCCVNAVYSKSTQQCTGGIVETKCGSGWYNEKIQFCYNSSKIGYFCGANPQKSYNPDFYECRPPSNGIYLREGMVLKDKTYDAVLIYDQVWMAENVNDQSSGICYDNTPANCDKYGRLYTWSQATTICPSGWNLPTLDEWNKLLNAVGSSSTAGKLLKATSGWYSTNGSGQPADTGTDIYGFKALPGGYKGSQFGHIEWAGYWWSKTDREGFLAYRLLMHSTADYARWNHDDYWDLKTDNISVRCFRNK